jgi:rhodanese-related sulfurtransferase
LLKLPEETFIYPAHDYKGENVSTIGEEKKFNPRLQVSSAQEYALIMNNLNLSNPKMMDIAVPENKKMGLSIEKQIELSGITYDRFKKLSTNNEVVLIDLRESIEIKNIPALENSINVPYTSLQEYLKKDKEKLKNKTVVFYCAVGERSALAVQASQSYNFRQTYHLAGGLKNL